MKSGVKLETTSESGGELADTVGANSGSIAKVIA